jgi:hypothetical protein
MIDGVTVRFDSPIYHNETEVIFMNGHRRITSFGRLEDWMHENGIRYTINQQGTDMASMAVPCPQARVMIKLAFDRYERNIIDYGPNKSLIGLLPGATQDKLQPWKPR